jgi:regulation of enolase protein 1 (concanavalin A-like superfamily)
MEVPMSRLAAFLPYALLAATVTAAPIPPPRPWVQGWDRPVDPVGDCRFVRRGDKLTITVPAGEARRLDRRCVRKAAPRLLRDVEGGFAVQVRVACDFRRPAGPGDALHGMAGILVTDGKTTVRVERAVTWTEDGAREADLYVASETANMGSGTSPKCLTTEKPGHLRLRRRGGTLAVECSEDGLRWTPVAVPDATLGFEVMWKAEGLPFHWLGLRQKVKVGVVAEVSPGGEFTARFDQFKLTPLGPDGKPLGGRAR